MAVHSCSFHGLYDLVEWVGKSHVFCISTFTFSFFCRSFSDQTVSQSDASHCTRCRYFFFAFIPYFLLFLLLLLLLLLRLFFRFIYWWGYFHASLFSWYTWIHTMFCAAVVADFVVIITAGTCNCLHPVPTDSSRHVTRVGQ